MKKMRSARLGLCLVILTAASCGFPRLLEIADGGVGTEDGGSPPLDLELLAGDIGGSGNADGTGAVARFYEPTGAAVDSAGNVYVADWGNSTLRKVTAAGVVSTLMADFYLPFGVAVDSVGNVYVADQENSTIRVVTAAGVVTTLAGTPRIFGSADGSGAAARFYHPSGLAVDSAGNVYVADTSNHTIRKVTAAGVVTTLAGTAGTAGSADGGGAIARFNQPTGVAVDSTGNIYVVDQGNDTIRKMTVAGVVTTLAGTAGMTGGADGTGAAARLAYLTGIAVDSTGNIYVADASSHTIRKVTAAGAVTTLAGTAFMSGSADGTGTAARFNNPSGVTVDNSGNIYAAEPYNTTLRKVTPAGVMTMMAGTASITGSTDGRGADARFSSPSGVAVDSAGNIYVADTSNDTIRKVTTNGVVTTLADTASVFGSVDGTGAAARFGGPFGMAVNSTGNVYVTGNNTIRKVAAAGGVITSAGTASMAGSTDGTGAAARFNGPAGVGVVTAGNVYVADNQTVRKVTLAGVVTILAGTAGMAGSADGTGTAARFSGPNGVAVDRTGNVYVADRDKSTIRKVTPTGVVTTLAGAGLGRVDGTGTDARFTFPTGVAVDNAGNVYVADQENFTIRKGTPPEPQRRSRARLEWLEFSSAQHPDSHCRRVWRSSVTPSSLATLTPYSYSVTAPGSVDVDQAMSYS
jgi:uncharacterized protein YjiK